MWNKRKCNTTSQHDLWHFSSTVISISKIRVPQTSTSIRISVFQPGWKLYLIEKLVLYRFQSLLYSNTKCCTLKQAIDRLILIIASRNILNYPKFKIRMIRIIPRNFTGFFGGSKHYHKSRSYNTLKSLLFHFYILFNRQTFQILKIIGHFLSSLLTITPPN